MDDTYSVKISELEDGQEKVLVKKDGGLYSFEMSEWKAMQREEELSEYDLRRLSNAFSTMLEKESKTFVTSLEDLQELAKNPQYKKDNIIKINGLVSYYINKDIFLGKAYTVLNNNINSDYRVIYPNEIPEKKGTSKKKTAKDKEVLDRAKVVTEDFLDKINIREFIVNAILTSYTNGNFISYLNGDASNGYSIDEYPLDLVDITKIKIGGANVISLDVKELKSRIEEVYKQYSSLKSVTFMDVKRKFKDIVAEDYPDEVVEAVGKNDKVALLNPERTGVCRYGNLKGLYGLTPLFKALKSLLLLEQMDSSDSKTLMAKNKKIFYQKTRKELLEKKENTSIYKKEIEYAQGGLMAAMSEDVVLYTSQPYVDDLTIIEPSSDLTNPSNIAQCKGDVINAIGINYTINEGKGGVASSKYSYEDLLKTINTIAKVQVEPIINKFIQVVIVDNGFDVSLSPRFEIQPTSINDLDDLIKICELYRNKLNLSYETVLETMGLDIQDEVIKRTNENAFNNGQGIASTFYAYPTAFNSSGETGGKGDNSLNGDDTKNLNGSKKSANQDKAIEDKVNNDMKK